MTPTVPQRYFNRELSWLEFNQRVLDEAVDPANPLLERLKFFCIVSTNLDEFFEVRVAGLKQQMEGDVGERSPDGLTPAETFRAVNQRVRRLVDDQYRCWREQLVPELARHGFQFLRVRELDEADRAVVERHYRSEVGPTLTPLSIDSAHPFPQLLNRSLNLIIRLEIEQGDKWVPRLAVVQVPRNLRRLVELPRRDGRRDHVFLGQLIGHMLADLFPGTRILGFWAFRVTRNSELYIDDEEVANVLKAVESELHNRRRGEAVRLEIEPDCPEELRNELLETLHLGPADLYLVEGPLSPGGLMSLCLGGPAPELSDPPFLAPLIPAAQGEQPGLFDAIRQRDLLLHHPYESFETVIQFLQQAAVDPQVLAIKQTLYRTGGDSRIVGALMDAVKNGKQVTAVIELRARFDEAKNIEWARRLEEAGVHVLYGLVGYKIHCKLTLVVRRDPDGIRRYLHLGTGNYNPTTARLYTDLGLLTCHPDLGDDVASLFNLLTGVCQFQPTRRLLVAPFQLHERILDLIRRETGNARRGVPARIIAKMNSLVDPDVIEALYEASQAGVKIDLIVRGICCLRPGVPGLSENIAVRSIVGRFLEHGRIFTFENACRPEVYVGSADWMPRNFIRRIEAVFPIEDGVLRDRILSEILARQLADNRKARVLQADGTWTRVPRPANGGDRSSQAEFITLAVGGPVAGKVKPGRRSVAPRLRVRKKLAG